MNGGETFSKHMPWNRMRFPFSSVRMDEDTLYAASPGNGIYQSVGNGDWMNISGELGDNIVVNRLHAADGKLYACTNDGLYKYENGEWELPELAIPCYQYKTYGACSFAATHYGLWHNCGADWHRVACSDRKVYDFIQLPQFLIIGHDQGISMYDRFMDEWNDCPLKIEVTSLAVYKGHLLGAGAGGEVIIGNRRGSFDVVKFGSRLVFTLVRHGSSVFACTDKGLYRIGLLRGQITLFSVKTGFPVTDIDSDGEHLYMATLFDGIQQMKLPPY
ncbi:hypothetical protein [Paenibacillus xylaniclasticus]|uniref:hypothetical protein n=1 Tax=Paenibacillus xylaniclasticus TaxID=588083 RepID=UPI000FD938E3|nr:MULTISPECIES: hypothetical protein [Paenibacillus]GFN31579.1 hypothetical protein PCURB6_18390 [Paenibacillus curdlanolyticus]